MPYRKNSAWEWWCLVSSDRHFDSKKSDRDLQLKHLRQAKERNAAVFDNGDLFDLMGGKQDKRSRKSDLRPEYEVPNYFDAVIADAAEFFGPFARNFVTVAMGNHETAVLRHHEINPTERFVTLMNAVHGGMLTNGGYSGFLFFNFRRENSNASHTVIANYHHGLSAGKTPSNVSAHERRAAYVPDADIIITGHAHNFWAEKVARVRVNRLGTVSHDTQLNLGVPSYKDDIGDASEGWAVENGFRPKALGAWWLRFFYDAAVEGIGYEAIAAT